MARQIFLDTETTGFEISDGNRIIEIGAVEMIDRKATGSTYHQYINPERDSEEGALGIHGLTTEFLSDKPLFEDIYQAFLAYVDGAELLIHNAPFDVKFLNHEFSLAGKKLGKEALSLEQHCKILDTLILAREKHPGQRNSLDALCKRYDIRNDHRTLHGALLDSELLADVYLAMTGGQTNLLLDPESVDNNQGANVQENIVCEGQLNIIRATDAELKEHEDYLKMLVEKSGKQIVSNF